MSEVGKGRKHSEDSKKMMSVSHIGVKLSEEHKKNLSESGKGRKHSEDSKKMMSKSAKGEKNSMYGKTSPNKGKKTSNEIKDKIKNTNRLQTFRRN